VGVALSPTRLMRGWGYEQHRGGRSEHTRRRLRISSLSLASPLCRRNWFQINNWRAAGSGEKRPGEVAAGSFFSWPGKQSPATKNQNESLKKWEGGGIREPQNLVPFWGSEKAILEINRLTTLKQKRQKETVRTPESEDGRGGKKKRPPSEKPKQNGVSCVEERELAGRVGHWKKGSGASLTETTGRS